MALVILVQKLDLHLRHVDTGRAFSLATLAADTEFHGFLHSLRSQRLLSQLPGQRQPQRIGPPTGYVTLIAGHPVGRAHRPSLELAARAIVVAHLDGTLKTTRRASPT